MELSPVSVYKTAVEAIPEIKYALGVAGVIAAAMIIYNISSDNPQKAILAFIFTLAGMYLLLVFANVSHLTEILRGPIILTVWAVTILFIISLACVFSAFAWGTPEGIAWLVGATPASLRQVKQQAQVTLTNPAQLAGTSSPPRPREPVQETFQISDRSDDCDINRNSPVRHCLGMGAKVLNWVGPAIATENCGSTISNVRIVDGNENCIAADVHLQGCGYDRLPFGIRNCKGRGWISGSIVVNGEVVH